MAFEYQPFRVVLSPSGGRIAALGSRPPWDHLMLWIYDLDTDRMLASRTAPRLEGSRFGDERIAFHGEAVVRLTELSGENDLFQRDVRVESRSLSERERVELGADDFWLRVEDRLAAVRVGTGWLGWGWSGAETTGVLAGSAGPELSFRLSPFTGLGVSGRTSDSEILIYTVREFEVRHWLLDTETGEEREIKLPVENRARPNGDPAAGFEPVGLFPLARAGSPIDRGRALFVQPAGSLVSVDLDTGARTSLVPRQASRKE